MTMAAEIIKEAAQLISMNERDLKVLKEQKRIFNKYVNQLIRAALEEKP